MKRPSIILGLFVSCAAVLWSGVPAHATPSYQTQTFSASGTWTIPSDVAAIDILVVVGTFDAAISANAAPRVQYVKAPSAVSKKIRGAIKRDKPGAMEWLRVDVGIEFR